MVCITTRKVIPAEETLKVMVKGLGYWVRINETNVVAVGQKFGLNCKELESISQTSLKQDLCLEASRDSSKSMKNRLHDEDQSSYILDMQDRRLQKSQSHQSLARDHIRYLDKWERNKWNLSEQVDNSSSESSKRKYG